LEAYFAPFLQLQQRDGPAESRKTESDGQKLGQNDLAHSDPLCYSVLPFALLLRFAFGTPYERRAHPIDGSLDQGRGRIGQRSIFLSRVTEEDILAGKLVNGESFLNNIVSRPSDQGGGRREGDKI